MITMTLYRKRDCRACKVMTNIICDAINNVNSDTCLKIRNAENYTDDMLNELNIKYYPTLIFTDDNDNEIARLEGTYPVEYITNLLEKL